MQYELGYRVRVVHGDEFGRDKDGHNGRCYKV